MSHKNETAVLVTSLFITAIFIAAVAWWVTKPQDKPPGVPTSPNGPVDTTPENPLNSISFGEKILVAEEVRGGSPAFKTLKQAGVNDIAAGKYNEAVSQLSAALRENRNAPETLIYLNNARINLNQQKSYTIAVAVPIGSDPNGSLEVLRGVALAQNEINQAGGINGVLLKVAIANDNNQEEQAKKIASALVDNKDVLGVVGHWASQVTLAVAPIYDSKLVAISPISTAVSLSGKSLYIFRTVPSDYMAARALADYMLTKLQRRKVAVFFNSKSTYSQSLKSEFVTAVGLAGGQVKNEYDLSDSAFSAAGSVEQAIEQGAEVLMLASNTGELDKALQVVQVNRKRLSMLAGDDVYAIKTLEIGADAALGMVVAVPWDIDGDPTSAFPRQARELFGSDVNWRTALAYDAAKALIAAIQRNPTRTGVQQALASSDFTTKGASGTIGFLPSGDRNGTIQLVKIVADKRSPTTYDFVPVPR
ncbi:MULTISPECIES: ABC transporter substrate-binding protein [Cyanophyceae]|uniref:ABC transporter substrate-binding protein n=1 Tax=Cyanophyceae TaxID=3028117 RepID=UPI0016890208|nr:ABC transporter substrate-binding protein [Trichocoleus sp. FACHB-69]MBD1931512.1 amino acid ABC transporter substrate-binding protein [Trichocoleus sp. FACHB-69]